MMKILFEAKAIISGQMIIYNIFRLPHDKYKAEISLKEETEKDSSLPTELVLTKNNGTWQTEQNTENNISKELATTLGTEIDVFNTGYGDLLGRIGVS